MSFTRRLKCAPISVSGRSLPISQNLSSAHASAGAQTCWHPFLIEKLWLESSRARDAQAIASMSFPSRLGSGEWI